MKTSKSKITPEQAEALAELERRAAEAHERRAEGLREHVALWQDLFDTMIRTGQRWEDFRRGPMRALVVEVLRAAPAPEDLRAEDGWCPIGGPDHGLPRSWNRWVEGETVRRWRSTGDRYRPFPEPREERMQEILVPIVDPDITGRPVVCVHPPTWADYIVAFGLEDDPDYRRFRGGEWAYSYEGPGGAMIARPLVYHGIGHGFSRGEIHLPRKYPEPKPSPPDYFGDERRKGPGRLLDHDPAIG
jgi:hypothetical protein